MDMVFKSHLPLWRVKAMWRATSVTLLINAEDEEAAWDKGWKHVARMQGGDMCMELKVLGRADING